MGRRHPVAPGHFTKDKRTAHENLYDNVLRTDTTTYYELTGSEGEEGSLCIIEVFVPDSFFERKIHNGPSLRLDITTYDEGANHTVTVSRFMPLDDAAAFAQEILDAVAAYKVKTAEPERVIPVD